MVNIRPQSFSSTPDSNPEQEHTQTEAAVGSRQWSPFQQAIFDFVEKGKGSATVVAVAGSGKTTTIVEAAKRLPQGISASFVAFNKSIADELKQRLPGHVRAQTMNSLGFGAWRRHLGGDATGLRLDANKTRELCRTEIPDQFYGLLSKGMPRLIGVAKACGIVPMDLDGAGEYDGLIPDSDDVWSDIVERYGIDMEADVDKPSEAELIARYARKILTQSIAVSRHLIDFDDQLYMPVITGARFWQNDILFVDEAQDLNMVQRVIVRRALKGNGRLIAVGDPNQAIYMFRGAGHNSMDELKEAFNCQELPLTISYRCPKLVVAEAQRFVTHIRSHEQAKDGVVEIRAKYSATDFQGTDLVICRNSKPLIELAFRLLRDGVPCKVRGRDIGQGLVALVRRFKEADLDKFQTKLDEYVSKKTWDWLQKRKEDLAQRLQDQYDTLQVFIEALDPGSTTDHLVQRIEGMFTDNGVGSCLMLSTIHKSKGTESRRIWILDWDLMPSRFARTPEAKQQERNLQYVALTRSLEELRFITSKGFVEGKQKSAGNQLTES